MTDTVDLIIIGAGITGLYLSYVIHKRNPELRVMCVEQSDRVGGRLSSATLNPLDYNNENNYKIEGCAQRFFKGKDVLVQSLLHQLNITSIEEPNTQTIASSGNNHYNQQQFIEYMEKNKVSLPQYTFPQIYANYSLLYKDNGIQSFIKNIGYPLFEYPINAHQAYLTLQRIQLPTQSLITNGYINLCHSIFNISKKGISFKFNCSIERIGYDSGSGCYVVSSDGYGEWYSKKVVFTGAKSAFMRIDSDVRWIEEAKSLVEQHYFLYRAMKLYLYFSIPWWNSSELWNRYTNDTPLNQLVYYSQNIILIYNNMQCADLLHTFIPFELRGKSPRVNNSEMQWLPKNMIENGDLLRQWIQNQIGNTHTYINEKSWQSLEMFSFRYTKNASQFVQDMPLMDYNNLFKRLNNFRNFYLLSGDYTQEPGWVESCLECVEKYYDSISQSEYLIPKEDKPKKQTQRIT